MPRQHKRGAFRREIHTGLYGPMAERVLNNVICYCRSFGSSLDSKSFKMTEVERGVDNEVLLSVFDDSYNVSMYKTVFRNGLKNDAQIRLWLAGCVKGAAKTALAPAYNDLHKAEIAKIDGWSRTNETNIYMTGFQDRDIPVAAYYAVYEVLKGRKVAKGKFPGNIFASTVGEPFDPVRVELETYRIEETDKIRANLTAECTRLDKEFQTAYDELRKKFTQLKNEARAKAEEAERALNTEISETLNIAA